MIRKGSFKSLWVMKKSGSLSKPKSPKEYGLREFEDLSTSTSTVMVYTNISFDVTRLFSSLKITPIDVPLTKKQNVDKDKIDAPYGAIVSIQSKTKIRGVNLRKKKKHWCTVCQPMKIVNDKEVKILTITEHLERVYDAKGAPTDCQDIIYYCSKCQRDYRPEEQKKINHFLNQLTIILSLGKKDQALLNIMMFKNSFKMAGCKNKEDAMEASFILWQDNILMSPKAWSLRKGANNPRFIFETVMRNVGFKLGFAIERPSLNELMNSEEYSEKVFMSQYESSAHTNVNIKMFSERPKGFKYECLVVPLDTSRKPFFTYLDEIPVTYKVPKKPKKVQGKYTTFIVFSSSEIILSGRYDENMEEMYNFFIDTVLSNRDMVEEKLNLPDRKEIERIRSRARL
jgi:hypothetical protein